jgi:hypothetical protein
VGRGVDSVGDGGGGASGGAGDLAAAKRIGAGWINSRNPRQCGSAENGADHIQESAYRSCISVFWKSFLGERRYP